MLCGLESWHSMGQLSVDQWSSTEIAVIIGIDFPIITIEAVSIIVAVHHITKLQPLINDTFSSHFTFEGS